MQSNPIVLKTALVARLISRNTATLLEGQPEIYAYQTLEKHYGKEPANLFQPVNYLPTPQCRLRQHDQIKRQKRIQTLNEVVRSQLVLQNQPMLNVTETTVRSRRIRANVKNRSRSGSVLREQQMEMLGVLGQ